MSKTTTKPAAVAVALASGILLAGSTFAMEPLAQGYLLAAPEAAKAGEGKCGEGKCGEGKCGMAKADTDKDGKVSQADNKNAVAHRATTPTRRKQLGTMDGMRPIICHRRFRPLPRWHPLAPVLLTAQCTWHLRRVWRAPACRPPSSHCPRS